MLVNAALPGTEGGERQTAEGPVAGEFIVALEPEHWQGLAVFYPDFKGHSIAHKTLTGLGLAGVNQMLGGALGVPVRQHRPRRLDIPLTSV